MIKLDGLEGRDFVHGTVDCYSVIQDFFFLNFGLKLPDFARPNNWWEPDENGQHLNLYMDGFHEAGFSLVHEHPRNWRPADVILMAILSPVANHGAVLLPGERILHHLVGQRSCVESYNRPLFRDTTVAVLRHTQVDGRALVEQHEIDVRELVPQRVLNQLEELRQGRLDV